MKLAIKSVSLSFNDMMSRQIDGISLYKHIELALTNIFVGFLEKQPFNKVSKPYSYVRYVYDTFACFSSRNEALKFLSLSE